MEYNAPEAVSEPHQKLGYFKYGPWKVFESGDMEAWKEYTDEDGDTRTQMIYDIPKSELIRENWIEHIMDKTWVSLDDFVPAYFHALKHAGINELKIDLF